MADREKVIELLNKALTRVGRGDMDNVILSEVEDAIESAIALLWEQEPVIVRCKDCKFWHDPIRCQMDSEGLKTPDDWFCADAERR